MISPYKLFMIPILTSWLCIVLFPVGLCFWLYICFKCVEKNSQKVINYSKGINYEQNEIRKEELEELK